MNSKHKNIALILSFILLLWMAHELSFSKTLALSKEYHQLQKEILLFENGSQKLMTLQAQNKYYDSILKSKNIATHRSFQNTLLRTINSFADSTNISISTFHNPHVFITDNTKIFTYSFSLKGNFNQITKLIYLLEQEFKLGKIISVNFLKKKDFRKRSEYLECTVRLQQIVD